MRDLLESLDKIVTEEPGAVRSSDGSIVRTSSGKAVTAPGPKAKAPGGDRKFASAGDFFKAARKELGAVGSQIARDFGLSKKKPAGTKSTPVNAPAADADDMAFTGRPDDAPRVNKPAADIYRAMTGGAKNAGSKAGAAVSPKMVKAKAGDTPVQVGGRGGEFATTPAKPAKVKATAANTKDFDKTMAMQQKLRKAGFDIAADGIMGPATRAALAKYNDAAKKPTGGQMNRNKYEPITGAEMTGVLSGRNNPNRRRRR